MRHGAHRGRGAGDRCRGRAGGPGGRAGRRDPRPHPADRERRARPRLRLGRGDLRDGRLRACPQPASRRLPRPRGRLCARRGAGRGRTRQRLARPAPRAARVPRRGRRGHPGCGGGASWRRAPRPPRPAARAPCPRKRRPLAGLPLPGDRLHRYQRRTRRLRPGLPSDPRPWRRRRGRQPGPARRDRLARPGLHDPAGSRAAGALAPGGGRRRVPRSPHRRGLRGGQRGGDRPRARRPRGRPPDDPRLARGRCVRAARWPRAAAAPGRAYPNPRPTAAPPCAPARRPRLLTFARRDGYGRLA